MYFEIASENVDDGRSAGEWILIARYGDLLDKCEARKSFRFPRLHGEDEDTVQKLA